VRVSVIVHKYQIQVFNIMCPSHIGVRYTRCCVRLRGVTSPRNPRTTQIQRPKYAAGAQAAFGIDRTQVYARTSIRHIVSTSLVHWWSAIAMLTCRYRVESITFVTRKDLYIALTLQLGAAYFLSYFSGQKTRPTAVVLKDCHPL